MDGVEYLLIGALVTFIITFMIRWYLYFKHYDYTGKHETASWFRYSITMKSMDLRGAIYLMFPITGRKTKYSVRANYLIIPFYLSIAVLAISLRFILPET